MRVFRAWIDERGSNEDRDHAKWCEADLRAFAGQVDRRCPHIRLRDLETGSYRIVTRLLTRRHPPLLQVLWFRGDRGRTVLRIGKRLWWKL